MYYITLQPSRKIKLDGIKKICVWMQHISSRWLFLEWQMLVDSKTTSPHTHKHKATFRSSKTRTSDLWRKVLVVASLTIETISPKVSPILWCFFSHGRTNIKEPIFLIYYDTKKPKAHFAVKELIHLPASFNSMKYGVWKSWWWLSSCWWSVGLCRLWFNVAADRWH